MIGFIILILLAIKIFRSAKETGRNPYLWATAAVGVYVLVQVLIGLFLTALLFTGNKYWGWSERALDNFVIPITFLSVILSLIAVWIIDNYLANETLRETAVKPPEI